MTVKNFPDIIIPWDMDFRLLGNTQEFPSPLSQSVQTSELPGAKWIATLAWQAMDYTDAYKLQAFLNGLLGMAGRFYLGDFRHETPSGIATGTPLVKGLGTKGSTSLDTDGWTASQTGIMKAGDYFKVGYELKQMTADVDSDGDGNATLVFVPELRAAPADNAPLTVQAPKCVMMLKDDNQNAMPFIAPRFYRAMFECIEDFVTE